jgi:hypothetical protein
VLEFVIFVCTGLLVYWFVRTLLLLRALEEPNSGPRRILVILAVHAACIIAILFLGAATEKAIFFVLGERPILSGPGLIIWALGMIAFLSPVLYLIGKLESWRQRTKPVSGKRS